MKIRVLVVDDAPLFRAIIKSGLQAYPHIEVVATAENGKIALEKLQKMEVDFITMDLEMPVLSGVPCIQEIRKVNKDVRILVISATNNSSATRTIECLRVGADDFIAKEEASIGDSATERQDLLAKMINRRIEQFFDIAAATLTPKSTTLQAPPVQLPERIGKPRLRPKVLCMASSTGGPVALMALFGAIKQSLGLPILLVQHMPPIFTTQLARSLNDVTALSVKEAKIGDVLENDTVYVAPGNYHMRVIDQGGTSRIELNQADKENSVRPSADVLFRSVAAIYGSRVLTVIMTGMGHDGLEGVKILKEQGGTVYSQDAATSVVYGMPRAVAEAGLSDGVMPLDAIGPQLVELLAGFR